MWVGCGNEEGVGAGDQAIVVGGELFPLHRGWPRSTVHEVQVPALDVLRAVAITLHDCHGPTLCIERADHSVEAIPAPRRQLDSQQSDSRAFGQSGGKRVL